MKTLLTLSLILLSSLAMAQSKSQYTPFGLSIIDTASSLYGKCPKNDTVAYFVEILDPSIPIHSEWLNAFAVRHYELQGWSEYMNWYEGYRPVIDYYIYHDSKTKIRSHILRTVAL